MRRNKADLEFALLYFLPNSWAAGHCWCFHVTCKKGHAGIRGAETGVVIGINYLFSPRSHARTSARSVSILRHSDEIANVPRQKWRSLSQDPAALYLIEARWLEAS